MKILYVADSYYPHVNGVYYFVRRLATNLQNNGHEVAVMAPAESGRFTHSSIDGISVYGMPSISALLYKGIRLTIPLLLKKRINKVISTFRPDVIHLQNHFTINKAVMEVNKIHKIPVVATNHFMTENLTCFIDSPRWKRRISRWLWKGFSHVFNQAAIVTTPTETASRIIRSHLKVNIQVISNGIDLERFNLPTVKVGIRQKYAIPDKAVLLYVGRLDPEKHLVEVLEAVAIALKQIDFCFVVVGKGTQSDALKKHAQKLGIEEAVIFTGFVQDEDLPHLYKCSRCFIIASIAELQSIATMEAMASGLPVIAADAGALSELVVHKLNGYLFQPGDVKTIVESIQSVIGCSDTYLQMRRASREMIICHDIKRTVTQFENLYRRHLPPRAINKNKLQVYL